jgi:membrane protein implicated in regulation of membrane protease activity
MWAYLFPSPFFHITRDQPVIAPFSALPNPFSPSLSAFGCSQWGAAAAAAARIVVVVVGRRRRRRRRHRRRRRRRRQQADHVY